MAKIYISSTCKDLKKEREAAAKAVRRLGHQPIAMEDYVAADNRPVDKCLEDVRSCDAYIGIFAWRYGYIPGGYDKSITHLEYEEAGKAGIPRLIFILHEDATWPVRFVSTEDERNRIDLLRDKLQKDHTVSFFNNADELNGLVSAAVSNLAKNTIDTKTGNEHDKIEKTPIFQTRNAKEAIYNSEESVEMPEDVNKVAAKIGKEKVFKNDKDSWEVDFGDGTIMVYIKAGEFTMGSNENSSEKPPHQVYLDAYWLGKYEVTVGQYRKFIAEKENRSLPKISSGDNHPVVAVSWHDAVAYCDWLSERFELEFKLPTEAQWEKGARGRDGRRYPWGNQEANKKLANLSFNTLKTTPVGSYPAGASPYGLLDMVGSVFEWCCDWYDENYYQKPESHQKNPACPQNGFRRVVVRGGFHERDSTSRVYPHVPSICRSSERGARLPDRRMNGLGFRLCLGLPTK